MCRWFHYASSETLFLLRTTAVITLLLVSIRFVSTQPYDPDALCLFGNSISRYCKKYSANMSFPEVCFTLDAWYDHTADINSLSRINPDTGNTHTNFSDTTNKTFLCVSTYEWRLFPNIGDQNLVTTYAEAHGCVFDDKEKLQNSGLYNDCIKQVNVSWHKRYKLNELLCGCEVSKENECNKEFESQASFVKPKEANSLGCQEYRIEFNTTPHAACGGADSVNYRCILSVTISIFITSQLMS